MLDSLQKMQSLLLLRVFLLPAHFADENMTLIMNNGRVMIISLYQHEAHVC